MSEDPNIRWAQANPFAIQIDENADAWHAGHVNDVLALDSGGVVVGTESGGVWSIASTAAAIPLSDDWDNPDINCLAFGPDGPRHIYAGGSGLHETDTSAFLTLLNWRSIPLPPRVSAVNRIAVLKGTRRIVLACNNGVWWSSIPPAPTSSGSYNWKQAQGLPDGGYSGLVAESSGDISAVEVAAWGSNPATGLYGIFFGQWENNELRMRRAAISGVDATKMLRTSLAVCESDLRFMYAVGAGANGEIFTVLGSTDGGRSWTPCSIPDAGNQGDWNNNIAVHPTNPQLVALAWRSGPFISTNAGVNWQRFHTDKDNPHLHADLHALYFDPADPSRQRLYVGSDGGVVMTPDLGQTFISNYNRQLLNLQFLAPYGKRQWWGTLGVSYQFAGLIGGGLQDNDNVYCIVGPMLTSWKAMKNPPDDGSTMVFLRTGHLLSCPVGQAVHSQSWNGSKFDDRGTVPITGVKANPDGLKGPVLEIVNSPQFGHGSQLMYALGGSGSDVYGLFAESDGNNIHWEFLGSVNLDQGQYITAIGSSNGNHVFLGTVGGKIFTLNSSDGKVVQAKGVPSLHPELAAIARIIVQSDKLAFATYNVFPNESAGNVPLGNGLILCTKDGQNWKILGGGLPNEIFYGMDTDWTTNPKALFVTTDNRVYVSRNNGETWQSASQGLPKRSHCADLRFVIKPTGRHFLYLSTFGRSVWRAPLNIPIRMVSGNAAIIQSNFGSTEHGNFEVLVLEGSNLVHYWHDNSNVNLPWARAQTISMRAISSGSIIQSDFRSGDHGNFEVVALEGNELWHYWHDNSDVNLPWRRGQLITNRATGPACIIQSDFRSGDHGNFEVVVLEGNNLVHYWHDNSDVNKPWGRGQIISTQATGPGSIIQSNFRSGDHGNFEVVVLEGNNLVHYWHDNSDVNKPWGRGQIISTQATGPGSIIQSNFGSTEHGNFEVVVAEASSLVHYWHDNSNVNLPWARGQTITSDD